MPLRGAKRKISDPDGDVQARAKRAATRGYLRPWKKGQSGNPGGKPKEVLAVYREVRRLFVNASPAAAHELIELARSAEDERVRSVCAFGILDRAGIRPIEHPPDGLDGEKARFDPRQFSAGDLMLIESALKLLLRGRSEDVAPEPEIIPPGEGDGSA